MLRGNAFLLPDDGGGNAIAVACLEEILSFSLAAA